MCTIVYNSRTLEPFRAQLLEDRASPSSFFGSFLGARFCANKLRLIFHRQHRRSLFSAARCRDQNSRKERKKMRKEWEGKSCFELQKSFSKWLKGRYIYRAIYLLRDIYCVIGPRFKQNQLNEKGGIL